MFKVGDKGKTRGGWDYDVTGTDSWGWLRVNVENADGLTYSSDGKAFGLNNLFDLMPPINLYSESAFTWQQAVKDFALHFIETYNPANAADIATAALEFTGDDE